jgi:hypothetical protein
MLSITNNPFKLSVVMLSVTNKLFMLSVDILSVILLNVVALFAKHSLPLQSSTFLDNKLIYKVE